MVEINPFVEQGIPPPPRFTIRRRQASSETKITINHVMLLERASEEIIHVPNEKAFFICSKSVCMEFAALRVVACPAGSVVHQGVRTRRCALENVFWLTRRAARVGGLVSYETAGISKTIIGGNVKLTFFVSDLNTPQQYCTPTK